MLRCGNAPGCVPSGQETVTAGSRRARTRTFSLEAWSWALGCTVSVALHSVLLLCPRNPISFSFLLEA